MSDATLRHADVKLLTDLASFSNSSHAPFGAFTVPYECNVFDKLILALRQQLFVSFD